jgi:hypothetical protein
MGYSLLLCAVYLGDEHDSGDSDCQGASTKIAGRPPLVPAETAQIEHSKQKRDATPTIKPRTMVAIVFTGSSLLLPHPEPVGDVGRIIQQGGRQAHWIPPSTRPIPFRKNTRFELVSAIEVVQN